MKIDAGSHGVLESPTALVDPVEGSVHLRLVPVHVARLYPPDLRGDFVPCGGDPTSDFEFPLVRGARPVDVALYGGMRRSEISRDGVVFERAGDHLSRSWSRWIASALTPFGWVNHATPQFLTHQTVEGIEEELLMSLSLAPSCGASARANFHAAEEWLVGELGRPSRSASDLHEWRYGWGSVGLWYEPRDGAAEVAILWEPLHSEMMAELKERLGR